MTMFKRLLTVANLKILGALAVLAALMAFVSANNLCYFWYHQPKMPESVRRLR